MSKFTLNEFKKIVSKYFILLLTIPILTTGLVFVIEKVIIPQKYTASTQLLLIAKSNNQEGQTFDELRSSIQLISTFSSLIQSETVKNTVATQLGMDKISETVEVVTDQNSLIFTVNVTGTDGKQADAVANVLGDVVAEEFPKLFSSLSVHIMERSTGAKLKSINFQLLLAFVMGSMGSCIVLFFLVFFSSIISSEMQLRELGLVVLGSTPIVKNDGPKENQKKSKKRGKKK